jgi:hypothetical protein
MLNCVHSRVEIKMLLLVINVMLHLLGFRVNRAFFYLMCQPIPVALRFKTYVCCCSIAGIAGSNPAGGMDVRLLSVLCVV